MSDLKGDSNAMNGAPMVDGDTSTGYLLDCSTDYSGMTTYITLPGIWTVQTAPLPPVSMPALYTTQDGNTQVGFCFSNMNGTQYSGTCILSPSDDSPPKKVTITYPWSPPS
jgi:hypothetical protein